MEHFFRCGALKRQLYAILTMSSIILSISSPDLLPYFLHCRQMEQHPRINFKFVEYEKWYGWKDKCLNVFTMHFNSEAKHLPSRAPASSFRGSFNLSAFSHWANTSFLFDALNNVDIKSINLPKTRKEQFWNNVSTFKFFQTASWIDCCRFLWESSVLGRGLSKL